MAYDPTRPAQILDRPLYTYKDAVDHLQDWSGGSPDSITRGDARKACLEALREVLAERRWTFYYALGRLVTVAAYSTGTVAYDHTGGASERMVTLSSGTWPSWARFGTLLISNVTYNVATRESDTVITLEEGANPGADVASGTTYSLFRESYPLPEGFRQMLTQVFDLSGAIELPFIHPQGWITDRRYYASPSTPRAFSIMGGRQYHGQDALFLTPPPSTARTYDFVFQRAARRLVTEDYSTGTVACTAAGTTLTGTGTTWTSAHKGAVVRVSSSASSAPTAAFGTNPAAEERIITAVGSSTSLTVDSAFSNTLSGVKYCISDPIDVEDAMLTLFLRTAERCMAHLRHRTDIAVIEGNQRMELIRACAIDNRWAGPRTADLIASYGFRGRFPPGAYGGDNE